MTLFARSISHSSAAGLTGSLDFGPGIQVAARSHPGAASPAPENQDNFLAIDGTGRAVFMRDQREHAVQLAGWPRGHARLAVLDGMGGHGHGREAAEAAVAGILRLPACRNAAELGEALDALHLELLHQFAEGDDGDPAARPPGTTLTLLELRPGQEPLLYHAGDSRLYEISAAHARPLTIDHVPATSFALHGLLGEEEWWQQVHGEHRPQISQAFILGNALSDPQTLSAPLYALTPGRLPPFLRRLADRRAIPVRTDATYLLASDGFWACARPQEWIARWPALLADAATAGAGLDALFAAFLQSPPPGLHADNLTALALRFRPPPARGAERNSDETALPDEAHPPPL
jgi:serine/threonine protein phosphatase PrpC